MADFAEILGIDKNPLNTSYVKILGHLGHFLAKYGNFLSFLAHFGLYNYIGENAGRASYPVIFPLAFTAISSEPLNAFFKMLGILERGDQGLQSDKMWRKSVILGSTPPPGALTLFGPGGGKK